MLLSRWIEFPGLFYYESFLSLIKMNNKLLSSKILCDAENKILNHKDAVQPQIEW